ncbi:hypothetical protein [Sphaerimonospora thailandensis]|uniref:Uncharacterized protein n=1 Tax=Sphaerimonospora thailandensis TaxID=795644 RepID=A0A8J3VYJ9_9ACTN|nr:hypothetical protein [Sphaerimonospora thailandensis]GIH70129.1 hypothetical protein Mth01_23820 [Sphaerimonospora thailandensis]
MRLLALPVTLIVVAALIYLLVVLLRPSPRDGRRVTGAAAKPRWEVDTVMEDGWTLVVVRKVAPGRNGPVELTKQTIRAIPDNDPNWDELYREAMTEARSRVSTLEIESF